MEGVQDLTGAGSNHGDRVIADGLAWKMAKELGAGRIIKVAETEGAKAPVGSLGWRRGLAEAQRREEWA